MGSDSVDEGVGCCCTQVKREKLRPLFTSGIGKKKEQGKHLKSKEGIKYFKRAETEWIGVYEDEKLMKILFSGCTRPVGQPQVDTRG